MVKEPPAYFCTYFDHRYLAQGLALYRSLRRYCPSFQLWVLCLDRLCYEALTQLRLPDVELISLDEFEGDDAALLRAKTNRSLVEYYFTCTPAFLLFILEHSLAISLLTYLDADLFFFADPAPVFDELRAASIGIIAHRFPRKLRHLEAHGLYNVGWVTFRRDDHGLDCLRWWRERCLEWCYDRVEGGRFADQKYLDDWPVRFSGTVVLQHKGANLAPWNVANYAIRNAGGRIWVDGQPLVFFHFHGLKPIRGGWFDTNLWKYRARLSASAKRCIYVPYIQALLEASQDCAPWLSKASPQGGLRVALFSSPTGQTVGLLKRLLRSIWHFLTGQYVWVFN
jgi:hypothetical protein